MIRMFYRPIEAPKGRTITGNIRLHTSQIASWFNSKTILLMTICSTWLSRFLDMQSGRLRRNEGGFTTAELLGNAVLGILALAVIWGLMQGLGRTVINFIQQKLTGG